MLEFEFDVEPEYEGFRIDKCIAENYTEFSRSFIQKQIKDGFVSLNNKKAKASLSVSSGDKILFIVKDPLQVDIVAENIPIDILYEDEDVIVVNKPKGMVVHPAPGHFSGTLVNALMYHLKDNLSGINGELRPGIVHRIDMNTTGSLIVCKNDKAHNMIAAQLKDHSLNRRYVAICHGVFKESEGRIVTTIGRHPKDRMKMAVNVNGGKEAITNYKVLEQFENCALVELKLETGRTHQIRVHMAHINHPVAGDDIYSNQKIKIKTDGQALHAKILGFIKPSDNTYIETEAPLPEYFVKLLDNLRKGMKL